MSAPFATTQWSRVLAARDGSGTESSAALAELCDTYWYPLYAYVRGRGYDPDTARDLTQAYFAELLEKDFLQGVAPEAGRFRSFLLASMKHFLSHEREKATALKRGGGTRTLSLDADTAERLYGAEPAAALTPAEVFERRWALTVLERALERQRQEAVAAGSEERYERLRPYLTGHESSPPYRDVAAELGISKVAVRGAVHRLRQSFGRHLRAEIGETVADLGEVDDEIRHLLQVVSPWVPEPT